MRLSNYRAIVVVFGLLATLAILTAAIAQDGPGASPVPAASDSGAPAGKKAPATSSAASTQKAKQTIAYIRLAGEVPQSPPDFVIMEDTGPATLREWLNRLAAARTDANVAAVALEIDNPKIHLGQALEFADAIRRLNEVKPVYTFVTGGRIPQYIVASAGEEMAIDPSGDLDIDGIAAEMMFFRGTLDWLGITPQMIQIGKYKGAAEPMENKEPSPEFKEDFNSLLDDMYKQVCEQIAAHRHMTAKQVEDAIDQGPFRAADAKRLGLVDQLVEKADWQDHVRKAMENGGKEFSWTKDYGKKTSAALDFSNPFALLRELFKGPQEEEIESPTVAIIHAEGVITSGRSGEGQIFSEHTAGAKTLIEDFKEAAADDRIKAVVFRIDSPGGSALASELIFQAVKRCKDKKPVIVSISGMGASGGYYIASAGTEIYADSTAIVGSIGVITGKLALTDALAKIGVSTYAFTRGKNAGLELSRPWDEREMAIVRGMAQSTYDDFTKRVSDCRGKKIKKIEDVAQGRVFTAKTAVENGLVDHVGGLRDAVLAAQKAANTGPSHFLILPRSKSILDLLGGQDDDDSADERLAKLVGASDPTVLKKLLASKTLAAQTRGLGYLLKVAQLLGDEKVLMAMPQYLSIKD
jgi:protease-4